MSFKLKRVEMLFPIPLLVSELDGAATLNPDLLAEIALRRSGEDNAPRSARGGWQSRKDMFERAEPAQRALCAALIKAVAAATREMAPKADFAALSMHCEGWVNINPAGGYNAPHSHPGAFWSGVYYVAMPAAQDGDKDGGGIEFLSSRPASMFTNLLPAPMTTDNIRLTPQVGTMLLFPAHVMHWVAPHGASEERVTVAFNAQFRRRASGSQSRS